MAGGKLSPRQKMVNLMYLVFIAMLALNMSKEVLSAFGLMNEKFEGVNKFSEEYNGSLFTQLETKASDNPTQFGGPFTKAKEVEVISKKMYAYIETMKKDLTKDIEREKGKLPYESMDKGAAIDEGWFEGDGYSKKGKEFIGTIEKYKSDLIAVFGNDVKYLPIINDIKAKFDLNDIKDNEGVSKKYLAYHFEHFPLIASITKLSAMQNDVKKTEQDIYNGLIGNTTAQAASMKNYTAIVIPEKSAFFSGEAVKGKIVLGRYDKSTVPTSVVVNGSAINLNTALVDGQVNFSFGAGNVGEHDITGKFTFMEDGKPVPIDIKGNYVVVPKPNSATISADKMNVVYRGVTNPMTISFAGISADKVSANAPGLRSAGKPGTFLMNPGSGKEVTINVSGTLPDGSKVGDKKVFRIKSIPAPTGAIGGTPRMVKGAKSRLEVSQISAIMEDFDFEVDLKVTGFSLKVAGQPTVVVSGDRVNAQCKAALARAGRGDQVIISEIKTKLVGSDILLSRTSSVIYEIQ
ncbi:gliding motility protein GldM [Flavobacterium sp. GT3R68]|uniref:type IX secretion system motor protein PorM/GldM n=1 Tax=Flavobacterium sp. GT3R68 TaxID=2594437 RepID=UPI000F85D16E|nr:gliding motility protein GldM [Flavobacterium sp. GT3R68]RTY90946.1 gliding motility protein GldM [Flavobacterium sp. GSN2]TRW90509.1 gliding motility protein GldM [Flavobacterium sp. GT3R68]